MEPLQQVADLAPIVMGVVAGANDYVDDVGGRILGPCRIIGSPCLESAAASHLKRAAQRRWPLPAKRASEANPKSKITTVGTASMGRCPTPRATSSAGTSTRDTPVKSWVPSTTGSGPGEPRCDGAEPIDRVGIVERGGPARRAGSPDVGRARGGNRFHERLAGDGGLESSGRSARVLANLGPGAQRELLVVLISPAEVRTDVIRQRNGRPGKQTWGRKVEQGEHHGVIPSYRGRAPMVEDAGQRTRSSVCAPFRFVDGPCRAS